MNLLLIFIYTKLSFTPLTILGKYGSSKNKRKKRKRKKQEQKMRKFCGQFPIYETMIVPSGIWKTL